MGMCVSIITSILPFGPRTLEAYCAKHLMPYPGDRVLTSTLMLHWVWQSDVARIIKYIHDEDPHGDRHVTDTIKNTLDCVRHYRDRARRPFMTPRERRRYDEFNVMRRNGSVNGQTIVTEGDKEFIADHRFT